MKIQVTKHAIKRYRERLFDYSATEDEVVKILREIAMKGVVICFKPNSLGNCMELKHKGISVVAVKDQNSLVVITCLGKRTYRKWVKAQMSTFISQRLLYVN